MLPDTGITFWRGIAGTRLIPPSGKRSQAHIPVSFCSESPIATLHLLLDCTRCLKVFEGRAPNPEGASRHGLAQYQTAHWRKLHLSVDSVHAQGASSKYAVWY